MLLSDDADLYYKGIGTAIERRAGRGTATPSGTDRRDHASSSSANDFAADARRGQAGAVGAGARPAHARPTGLRAGRPPPRGAQGRARARARRSRAASDVDRRPTSKRTSTGEIEILSAQGQGARGPGRRAAGALRRRRHRARRSTTRLPSLLVAINGGLVKVDPARQRQGDRAPCCCRCKSTADAEPGTWQIVDLRDAGSEPPRQRPRGGLARALSDKGLVEATFNWAFFTSGDSREPELAGIRGALVGSALTLLVTLMLCLPIGVAAAIYLEEFAPKNRLTEIIEVNINNLAAVPSIVFGLLGLAVFLNFFGLPRSAPLVGGLVLALLVLPTIIIASRAALEGGAAVDQGSRARRRRLAPAGDLPPRAAAGHARHHDRHHHRHGACARRDRAAPDDRHGRLHRRSADRHHRRRDRPAGSDLSSGRICRRSPSRPRPRPRSWCCWCSCSS